MKEGVMINEATLIGRIGKKSYRTLNNGSNMATLYVATSKGWKDSAGQKQERTTWHNVNFFDKLADIVEKYTEIGSLIYIKGEINNKQIESGERQGQWSYSITGNEVKILSYKKTRQEESKQKNNSSEHENYNAMYDDGIPF